MKKKKKRTLQVGRFVFDFKDMDFVLSVDYWKFAWRFILLHRAITVFMVACIGCGEILHWTAAPWWFLVSFVFLVFGIGTMYSLKYDFYGGYMEYIRGPPGI